jgi:stage II sporulation protein M
MDQPRAEPEISDFIVSAFIFVSSRLASEPFDRPEIILQRFLPEFQARSASDTIKTYLVTKAMSLQECLQYLRTLRPYFATSLTLLVLGSVLGVLAIPYAPDIAQNINQSVTGFVKLFRELAKPQLAVAIFLNNAVKTLVVIVGGVLFGIVPVIFVLVNGAALGFVLYLSIEQRGLFESLLAILPHGILELPAVLLGTSTGLKLGGYAVKKVFGDAQIAMGRELAWAMKFFLAVIVPMLAIAALVESFVTSEVVAR